MKIIYGIMIFLVLLMGTISTLYAYDTLSGNFCVSKGSKMGVNVEYSISTGCMANLEGQFVPINNVRFIYLNGRIKAVPY